jgi:hypothetical protein
VAARRLTVEILGEARQLNRTLGQVDTRMAKFERNTARVSKGVAAIGAGFVASRVVQGLNRATQAASALAETQSKTQVVFGKSAGIIFNFGKTSARSVGLSTQAAEEAAATFGNLFVAMKIGQRPAADMSVGLVKLAGDLASFNNVDPTQVLEDLRSGLVGEVEPLRKYGVALNAASVEQEAMRETGKRNAKQLTEAEKVTARYNLILRNTKTAQGDFARTSGGLANQQRILNAEWKDAQAQFGKALLPAMQQGVKVASALASGFTKLDSATEGLASKGLLAAAGLGGIGFAVGKTLKFVNESRVAWKALRAAKVAQIPVNAGVAASETVLTGATTASGTAAATAATRWTLLAGAVARFAGPAAIVVGTFIAVRQEHERYVKTQREALKLSDAQRERALSGIGPGGYILGTRDAVAAATKAWQDYNVQQLESARTIPPLAERTNVLGSQLDRVSGSLFTVAGKAKAASVSFRDQVDANAKLHESLLTTRDAILGQAEAFDHGRAASKVKTAGILADLAREVATLQTWAADSQTLIKRGMDPEAVKFLSDKGPEYVHAFAAGSDKQVAGFEKLFKQRMAASGTAAFNTTVGAAEDFRRMAAKANAEVARIKAAKARVDGAAQAAREFRRFRNEANAALNSIQNRSVKVSILSSFGAIGGAALVAAAHGRAEGGLITGPGSGTSDTAGLFALSSGEMVIPAANVRSAGGARAVADLVGMRHLPVVRGGGLAGGGVVRLDASGDTGPIRRGATATNARMDRIIAQATRLLQAAAASFGSPGIRAFIRSVDRLPYIWGGAGPGGYDCSGLVGAVYGKMRGDRAAGHGRRYFTTGSISTRVAGLHSGLGGTLNIGVTPGSGHMAGNYGGLGFEARSTRSGIIVGGAARSPATFARKYHMAKGGVVVGLDPEGIEALRRLPGVDIGGDASRTRVAFGHRLADQGAWLPPRSTTMVTNRTSAWEPVGPPAASQPVQIVLEIDGRAFAEATIGHMESARVRMRRR